MRFHRSHWVVGPKATGVFLTLLGSLCCAVESAAQPPPVLSGLPSPRLFSVMPAGGKTGSTLEVTFTGQDLEDPQALLFSHPGIKAEPIVPPAPPAPPVDPKKPAPKPAVPPPKPMVTKFKVSIAADTPLGIHDVRLVNKWGVSNPRTFVVGDLAEVLEKEPNDDVPQAQRVELNTTINGVIANPVDVDYFVFAGKKGQRVVVSCLASSIDSRLIAGLELYDARSHLLAFNRHYHESDAVLDAALPADGDYYVRLFEFTHSQGSPEHFYRLSISTAPWIDAIFPVVVEPGKPATLTVYGRNLPGGQPDPTAVLDGSLLEKVTVTVNAPTDPAVLHRLAYTGHLPPNSSALDGFEYRIRNGSGTSNPFLLTYARAPIVLDQDAHDTPDTAQPVPVPCEISGRINKLRDRDWYVFTARKNDVYNIEVLSDRLGAQTDMYFVLRKADTKQELVELDDNPDTLDPVKFYTHSEDPPVYRFTAPADGKYQLLVGSRDADTRASPRIYYRACIVPEAPDFRLIVLPGDPLRPDGCCLKQGASEYYTVLAWRQDGWTGPIALTVEGLPTGVTCPSQVLGPNLRHAALVLSAAPTAPAWTGEIKVKGTAVINGRTVVHEARPASITWPVPQPQGIPAVSRLDRSLVLAVRDKAPFGLTATADKSVVVQGTKVNVALKLARLWPDFKVPLQVAALDFQTHLPQNLAFNNNQPITIPAGKDTATAVLDVRGNVLPGTYNVVLQGTAQLPYNKDPMAKQKQPVPLVQPATPLVITVLPKQVANLSVADANPTVKAGGQVELVVRVARLNDYAGEFKVKLVLPPGVKGVEASETTIAAGQTEAKLILKVPAGTALGNRPNLVVQAVATLQGNIPLRHETKINVNVVK
jgi:hypothetical protein